MRTYVAKGAEAEALKTGTNWYVVDATNAVLGRLATRVARMLIGKDKPSFTPYLDSGDHVVVSDDLYGGTYRLFSRILERYGLDFTYVDMTSPEAVRAALRASILRAAPRFALESRTPAWTRRPRARRSRPAAPPRPASASALA